MDVASVLKLCRAVQNASLSLCFCLYLSRKRSLTLIFDGHWPPHVSGDRSLLHIGGMQQVWTRGCLLYFPSLLSHSLYAHCSSLLLPCSWVDSWRLGTGIICHPEQHLCLWTACSRSLLNVSPKASPALLLVSWMSKKYSSINQLPWNAATRIPRVKIFTL